MAPASLIGCGAVVEIVCGDQSRGIGRGRRRARYDRRAHESANVVHRERHPKDADFVHHAAEELVQPDQIAAEPQRTRRHWETSTDSHRPFEHSVDVHLERPATVGHRDVHPLPLKRALGCSGGLGPAPDVREAGRLPQPSLTVIGVERIRQVIPVLLQEDVSPSILIGHLDPGHQRHRAGQIQAVAVGHGDEIIDAVEEHAFAEPATGDPLRTVRGIE